MPTKKDKIRRQFADILKDAKREGKHLQLSDLFRRVEEAAAWRKLMTQPSTNDTEEGTEGKSPRRKKPESRGYDALGEGAGQSWCADQS